MSMKKIFVVAEGHFSSIAFMKIKTVINNKYMYYFNYSFAFIIHRIAVYDLGGGTFDISILEIQKGVFEVRNFVHILLVLK